MVAIFIRSLIFNILFYPVFLFWAIIALPTLVLPRTALLRVASWWAKTNILLMRVVCGIKGELKWIPIFGLFLIKANMIAIDRKAGGRALIAMMKRASEEVRRGRQFVIFPEGTRTAPGAPPN